MAKLISKTYGEALYEVAVESGKTREILDEIEQVRGILKQNPDFAKLMLHPSISKPEKLKVAEDVFRGRLSEELTGFLLILVEKERFQELDKIFEYYTEQVKAAQGIGVAYVTTPMELDAPSRSAVEAKLLETTPFTQMEMHYLTDPELIGGIIIRVGDRVADGSVRNKLNELTQELLQVQLG
ncbi:MAG: ATP synthase F1 subunit delta [Lachnospiraceae bacterium]|nr:ATP synthase F1 subunit delta [Lachnospiraceae bacterium]